MLSDRYAMPMLPLSFDLTLLQEYVVAQGGVEKEASVQETDEKRGQGGASLPPSRNLIAMWEFGLESSGFAAAFMALHHAD